jgi:hypothetical protein
VQRPRFYPSKICRIFVIAAILQPDYNRHVNVAWQALRAISLVVYKGVQTLDVGGPLYQDADVTNEPIAQRCGLDGLGTLRRAFLRRFGEAARQYRSGFHCSHPLRADSAPNQQ